mgnify:CR=1 FL=1
MDDEGAVEEAVVGVVGEVSEVGLDAGVVEDAPLRGGTGKGAFGGGVDAGEAGDGEA